MAKTSKSKKETVKVLPKEEKNAPQKPETSKNGELNATQKAEVLSGGNPKNESGGGDVPQKLSPEEKREALMPHDGNKDGRNPGAEKPSATQPIPPIKEKVGHKKLSSEDVIDKMPADNINENELAFGSAPENRSIKFLVNPNETKAPQYAVDDFRGYVDKYVKEKKVKPNVMFVNTDTLERMGFRDVATDLGLHIKESTVYNPNEILIGLDL